MCRGSRKHVLDWTDRPDFLTELGRVIAPVPVAFPNDTLFLPRGYRVPEEARLERFGRLWTRSAEPWDTLESWWLAHTPGANTPNWDIAVGCRLEDRPGLILVEAKANDAELKVEGKTLDAKASGNSLENHERIGEAIAEACDVWRTLDPDVAIARDSHYQLANRLAFTCKLATLGIPVVLLYLGFTGDEGIADVGAPFRTDEEWQSVFHRHASGSVPRQLFERRLEIGSSPVWLLCRSRAVLEMSPPRDRCAGSRA